MRNHVIEDLYFVHIIRLDCLSARLSKKGGLLVRLRGAERSIISTSSDVALKDKEVRDPAGMTMVQAAVHVFLLVIVKQHTQVVFWYSRKLRTHLRVRSCVRSFLE